MTWIKRNLSLAISGVLALGLLGFGAWYLWSAIQRNNAINGEIEQAKRDIENFLNKPYTPSQSNLNNARRELDRLAQFNAAARKQFPPSPPPPGPLTDESFKNVLQTTVNELHQGARAVGISLEPDYYFTFEAHKGSLQFRPEILRPLYDRLQEIKLIASILLQARVNHIVHFRRAAVPNERSGGGPGQGPGGANDYLQANPRFLPDTSMTVWPFEVTFDCFTSQLGQVLEALERIDQGIMVKALTSEPAPVAASQRTTRPADQPPLNRRQLPGNVPQAAPVRPANALETVIDEKLLRVTVHLEVLRPEQLPGGPGGPGGPGRGGRP